MRYSSLALLLAAVAPGVLAACGGDGCDDVTKAAFTATVRDEANAPVCDAQIVVTHASGQSTLLASDTCEYTYNRDVTGEFSIVVLRSGYQAATQTFEVQEDKDGCHAQTRVLTIAITPSVQPGGDRPGTR